MHVPITAAGPNSEGVVTELLFQKLKSIRWQPTKFYKSLGFHHFEAGELSVEVELEPGVYAFGWRFVRTATGQATGAQTLPVVVVEEAEEAPAPSSV